MVDRFERFSYAISEISRHWHKIAADEMERYGLKGPYAVYFTTLYQHEDGLTAGKLGELCSRDKADVSRAVTYLQMRGLVEKEVSGLHFYRAKIRLTEPGREIAEYINEKAMKAVEYVGKDLNEEQRGSFYASLESIVSNLQELSKKGFDQSERE